MKLKTKIHLFSTLLMLVILSLTNIGIYFVFEKMAYDTEYNQLQLRSNEITKSFSKVNEKTDINTVIGAYMPPNGAIRVYDAAGKEIKGLNTVGEIKNYKPQFKQDADYSIEKFEGIPVLSIRTPVIWTNGEVVELQMIQQLVDVKGSLRTLTLILLGVTFIAMIPIIISSIALSRIITHPIEKLIETMSQSRKAGTYEKINIPSNGNDEMGKMATTFNDLMDQLETNYNQQEQFVSNASHELRTPLTVIESYARLLTRRGFDNRDVAEEAVGAILGESIRMKEMIEQLLQLARNHEQMKFDFAETDIYEQVEKTLQPMRQAYSREFLLEGVSPAMANTDGEKLRQLLFILLDNARKYSDDVVKTIIEESDEGFTISVIDYGNGIPKDALPNLFNRFYRVDEDRSRKTGGTGLGLAIAKDLADGLGAGLKVESIYGMGTTIRIFVPKVRILTEF
ncbi:HAMP domain-containing histidine kinase [Sporosarcina sp. Marseille-Q4063]|uniref:HAMP domain-containing sensor histidine kinase n=1 Tax=Sporosarcina sp. Marseille-Q4063 TaxID=2810514 RepID=UPI001BAEEC66|nr:HAMP domain-containing histidine kinase [Sporosarcina sp. Marseille-Q4063]QUW20998.1 HAMP domain-containing histidine kinase [Sporosarcina sp. Marseille-Q4063]